MNGRILIVDDEQQWREHLMGILNREGYTVEAASTAKDALNILQQGIYHLVILDIRLEDSDQSKGRGPPVK